MFALGESLAGAEPQEIIVGRAVGWSMGHNTQKYHNGTPKMVRCRSVLPAGRTRYAR